MKQLILLIALIAAVEMKASETECQNIDDNFYEDTLTISSDRSSVHYFDNDTGTDIPCLSINEILVCVDRKWTVRIDKSGEGTVWEGVETDSNTIKFQCQ